jgi:hypothetical protein
MLQMWDSGWNTNKFLNCKNELKMVKEFEARNLKLETILQFIINLKYENNSYNILI